MKMMLRSALLVLLAWLPLSQAQAGEVLDRIAKTDTLRVGMTGSQPPFNVKDRNGELIGMEVDLANLLANAMGVKLDIVVKPFGELLPSLEKGDVDLVMSQVTATLERNRKVAFVGPYFVSGKSLLTKSSTVAAIQQTQQIDNPDMRVATLKGSTSETFVSRRAPKATLVTTDNYDEAVNMLLDNKVDAFLADAPIISLTAMRYPNAGLAMLNRPLTIEPIGIAVSPSDPLLLNLVQNYLGALQASGGLDALTKKWFDNPGWLTQLP